MHDKLVYLFGSQALSLTHDDAARLRITIKNTPSLQWLEQAVTELSSVVEDFSSNAAAFIPPKVSANVQLLRQFFASDMPAAELPSSLPNVLLTPLVVMGHLIEYTLLTHSTSAFDDSLSQVFGLCTGMLASFAIASSRDWTSLANYGAVALRLAVLIGAIVDASEDDAAAGPSRSFAAAWAGSMGREDILQIISTVPDAYMAVTYDDCRATITTSSAHAAEVQDKMQAASVTVTELGFHGRFHWTEHAKSQHSLLAFCQDRPKYHFADLENLTSGTRSNQRGPILESQRLHEVAIQSLLTLQPQWSDVLSEAIDSITPGVDYSMFMFGSERCVPPSLIPRVRKFLKQTVGVISQTEALLPAQHHQIPDKHDDIAIIGMSCKVSGAEDLEEFWELLCKGESRHREVNSDRFDFESPFRTQDSKRKWFGNLIDDYDAFDHKFFKKSPREASSTDPQQRQLLQSAYQAIQQSGYFRKQDPDRHVGCYIGVCSVDYENNIACHQPNAYSSIGNLRGFIAGKVSHYFGWTGPGLTIDTACSSSAVAIHQACQAILTGECNTALAGGTHVMTSSLWFQNLAGASFLSPTGSCKPFDAAADGYCRGEGVATVVLKRLSAAIADGDTVFATIAGTAVQQNENCTPIFVPNSPSLSDLFRRVTDRAQLQPEQITVVEAHGTGTPVGDPVEYNSVREVLGGDKRTSNIALSSVKGLIGHLECTSGVVSLIKIVMMMLKGSIPPQASFKNINPAIKSSPSDHITIPTSLLPWSTARKAALINNYGASGSNASIVVKESSIKQNRLATSSQQKHIFCFSALDRNSLSRYIQRFRTLLVSKGPKTPNLLEDISFNLLREFNPTLPERFILTASSISSLDDRLRKFEHEMSRDETVLASKPVILCFGGQSSTFVGLDQNIYQQSSLLQKHLKICDSACNSLGVGSIFPYIFQRSSLDDLTKLHCLLFSLQYSCVQAWIDCGVVPAAMVGHSFGELTALCASGSLSLEHCLKAIIGRAKIIESSWGSDTGAMMAVEGDLNQVEELLRQSNPLGSSDQSANIACFNGLRQFTVAGSQKAIDSISNVLSTSLEFGNLRTKRLNVTHAYHSMLTSPLMDAVEQAAEDVRFMQPQIQLERTTESHSTSALTPLFFAEHMRNPVYFSHAVQRLAHQYPNAVWLEAGSSSSVTLLAKRSMTDISGHTFVELNITNDKALDNLAETTAALLKAGVSTTFWLHHSLQSRNYAPLILPPYQFEKSRHWMEQKKMPTLLASGTSNQPVSQQGPEMLLNLVKIDKGGLTARFGINTGHTAYEQLLSGHKIAHTAPICPATAQLDFALESVKTMIPEIPAAQFFPELQDVRNLSPVYRDTSRVLWLDLEGKPDKKTWSFKITSTSANHSDSTTHTAGRVILLDAQDKATRLSFSRYERLRMHERCLSILNDSNSDEVIQGRNIYRAFSDVVDYGPQFRGLQKLVGRQDESAGRISQAYDARTWLDPLLSDVFCQVAGIFVNCMSDRGPEDMYLACEIENWMRSADLQVGSARPPFYNVLATHYRTSSDAVTSDVFVFDGVTGGLVEIVLGLKYRSVKKASMQRILARMTPELGYGASVLPVAQPRVQKAVPASTQHLSQRPKLPKAPKASTQASLVLDQIRSVLASFLGLQPQEILASSDLADLGVDSLMAMEMISELERTLKCDLPLDEVANVTTVSSLVKCVSSSLPGGSDDSDTSMSDTSSETDSSDSLPTTAATTPEERCIDSTSHLAEFLGLDVGAIKPSTVLRDLGVDSLLAIELRADLASAFDVHLSMDLCVEDLTIDELNRALGAPAWSSSDSVAHASQTQPPIVSTTSADKPVMEAGPRSKIPEDVALSLPGELVRAAFAQTKKATDDQYITFGCQDYSETTLPLKTELCIALIVEGLEQLGCHIRTARESTSLPWVNCREDQKHLRDYLYHALSKEAGLLVIENGKVLRTAEVLSPDDSQRIMARAVQVSPLEKGAFDLIYHAGSNLAAILSGKTDGIKLIFGNARGRELVSSLYGEWPINRLMYHQIENFLSRLSEGVSPGDGVLRVLEMGAGTGGTSQWLIPLLASLPMRVEYTFTDLAPSFVAAARGRFSQYDFIKYRTHDIEHGAPEDLRNSQHIVIASNAIHATHDITKSASHVKEFLRSDGLLLMIEMTTPLLWVDVIFGLFEGWWLFDDGRSHAVTNEADWRRHLLAAGYGSVDWTDGKRPENKLEKLIIAKVMPPANSPADAVAPDDTALTGPPTFEARAAAIEHYVQRMSQKFSRPSPALSQASKKPSGTCVLITGASGSLGAHLVSNLAERDDIKSVICLNRPHGGDPQTHQLKSLISRGILLSAKGLTKLQTFEGDMTQPMLGLPRETYQRLLESVTCIVHNAWTMSAKRPIAGFEAQFEIMGNLLRMASEIAGLRPRDCKTRFVFVSSIAVVGHYPIWKDTPQVPEERVAIEAVLPNGYGDAKWACELVLDRTLQKASPTLTCFYPDQFATSSIRVGQIAGSRKSGYWNPMEHTSFLWKSSQMLNAIPNLQGLLSWTPVDDVAGTVGDLSELTTSPHAIYNIDNPIRQQWTDMIPVLATALGIPQANIIPFEDWVSLVRESEKDGKTAAVNPASMLLEFLEDNFLRMSCGGLLLGTERAREHSETLRNVGPVSEEVARRFVQAWKDMRFLS
ncbi:polyketide synthase [Aureobasidium subglaciale]|nr:polyketide synthase [Aureobasidium subglaciale]